MLDEAAGFWHGKAEEEAPSTGNTYFSIRNAYILSELVDIIVGRIENSVDDGNLNIVQPKADNETALARQTVCFFACGVRIHTFSR